jgi:predicted enzyme related to lactoylglutathione lyase
MRRDASSTATKDSGTAKDGGSASKDGGGKASKDGGSTKDGGGSSAPPDADDAAVVDDGSAPAADGGPTEPVDIPSPMAAPMVWGFGLGVSDVPAASTFYTGVMKMTVEKDGTKRDDYTETTLYASEAKRGARVVLMSFDDMRNTRKITAKLVFQSADASAVNSAAAAAKYPDYVSRVDFLGVVQFDGPDTYIHEVGGSFDSGGSGISVPYPVALGFAVKDLAASRKFYVALGMTESSVGSFPVTDVNGMATIDEYSVKFEEGTGIVLQSWSPERNTKDNPLKVVMFVPSAKTMADKVVAAGGSIVKEAERIPAYDNRLVVLAKDLDGYILEIVE